MGRNSNRLDYLNLGVYGDRSGGSCGFTRRILHLDGLIAAETAEPSGSDPLQRFPVDLIRRSPIHAVTRGLDPRVHPLRIDFANVMDARVKPAHDDQVDQSPR